MTNASSTPVLSVKNLTKAFAGKTVVNGVSFDIYPGEIIALVGENGAGKTTTKNMLCGLLKPTSGEILVDGEVVPQVNGLEHGISAVHQELSLFQSLTVTENMCVTALPGHPANVDWKEAKKIAKEQLDFLGIEIDTSAILSSLGAGQQQIVEIAKALLRANKVLILDEPTTSLTAPEREKLFIIMNKLKDQGLAIIFISHFMDEIYKVCDKFITLRDGQQVSTGLLKDVPRAQLEEMMVGRTVGESQFEIKNPKEEEALRVEGLSSYDFHDVNFSVKRGEILGIAGLMGAGRTEIVESIFGVRHATGKVFVDNKLVSPITVSNMKAHGVCYVPEDRRTNGLFTIRSVKENISAANIALFVKRVIKFLGFKGEEETTQTVVEQMKVSIPHIDSKITSLSGGNQQKVLLGRWLATKPEVCILDEPTKGVDIGAKHDIHQMIVDLAHSGVAVIIVSSDLPELTDIAHRIFVMRTGHKVGEFARKDFDSAKIISLAASSAFETTSAKETPAHV